MWLDRGLYFFVQHPAPTRRRRRTSAGAGMRGWGKSTNVKPAVSASVSAEHSLDVPLHAEERL